MEQPVSLRLKWVPSEGPSSPGLKCCLLWEGENHGSLGGGEFLSAS